PRPLPPLPRPAGAGRSGRGRYAAPSRPVRAWRRLTALHGGEAPVSQPDSWWAEAGRYLGLLPGHELDAPAPEPDAAEEAPADRTEAPGAPDAPGERPEGARLDGDAAG
ncbi:MAG: hypothetical protein JWM48_3121, partial [Mycobacterium sp.]|nr:hypothetical protein [Mycobacterium sp.]